MPTPPSKSPPSSYLSLSQARLHSRSMSQSSQGSNVSARSDSSSSSAPTPTMEHLMRLISTAPKGSKVAQDASKALLIAERERFHRTGVPLAWPNVTHLPASPPTSPHQPPSRPQGTIDPALLRPNMPHRPSTVGPGARIGQSMLDAPIEEDEDQFALDVPEDVPEEDTDDHEAGLASPTFTPAPRGTSDWPLIPAYPPLAPQVPRRKASLTLSDVQAQETYALSSFKMPAGPPADVMPPMPRAVPHERSSIAIHWRGHAAQDFALVTAGTGQTGTDDIFPLRVAAQHTQIIEVPSFWMGCVRRGAKDIKRPYVQGHVRFDDVQMSSKFFVSYEQGNDGALMMTGQQSGVQSGSRLQALDVAPLGLIFVGDGGRALHGTAYGPQERRNAVCTFYNNFYSGPRFGAIMLADYERATRTTTDRQIVLDFYG